MREPPKNQISKQALTVWKLSALFVSIIYLFIVVGIGIIVHIFELSVWITVTLLTIWLIYSIITILIIPKVRHKVWRYDVHEHEIDLQYGFFIIKRVLVPMVRVQHVDTHQGPLLRKFQLASVEVSTAATKHEIPALNLKEAAVLRDHISRLARVTDDDE